jgi:vacuolar-type H+-ATPase subunit H
MAKHIHPTSDNTPTTRTLLIGLCCVAAPLMLTLLVEHAQARIIAFEPPAQTAPTASTVDQPLAGPKLTPDQTRTQTLIERDFDGKIKRLDISPEEAAIALLDLTPTEKAAADQAIAARAADMDALVTAHLLDIVRLGGELQSPRPGERAAAIREAYRLSGPILAKGRLIDRISLALPESQRVRYVALVDEYKKSLGDELIQQARHGKSDDVEFAAEVAKEPKNIIGHRMRARLKLELESFAQEIQRSAERIIAEKQDRGNDFLSKLQLTMEQQSKIQGIYADLAGKYGLKEPPKSVQVMLFARVLQVLTPEQRKQALVLIRDQERQKELDAKATGRSMQGMRPQE